MGRKRPIVIVSSSDDDEKKLIRTRSSSKSRSTSNSSRRGKSKRRSVGISTSRLFCQSQEADKFDRLSEDFGECMSDFSVTQGSKDTNMKEMWVDWYKPLSIAELAVQKKKVDEVYHWLEEKLTTSKGGSGDSTLLITGKSGVGKSSTVHVIASHLGAEVCEWMTPTPTLWREHLHNSASGGHYISKLDEFEIFIEKVGKYSLLHTSESGRSEKPVVVLIDDLPVINGKIALARLIKCLTALVRSSRVPTLILVSDYHKTESTNSLQNYSDELQSNLEKAGAHKVVFNPLTVNSIKKTLFRICEEEKCDINTEWIDLVAKASGGDIRNAITSLQYLCLRSVDSIYLPGSIQIEKIYDKHNSLSSQNPVGRMDIDNISSVSFGRDETLTLFHALGKFLHNKRENSEVHAFGHDVLVLKEKLIRNTPKMDTPEEILSQAHGQARKVVDFLHENVLDFINEEACDDAWLVTSYLCDADILLGRSLRSTRDSIITELYESDNLTQSVAASVAARGVLFGNSHPSPSRWHTIRSPKIWHIEQLSCRNKNQMIIKRCENLDGSNLRGLLDESFEYRPTVKWLQFVNSCKNMEEEDDKPDLMDQENDKFCTEDDEEDDIEEW